MIVLVQAVCVSVHVCMRKRRHSCLRCSQAHSIILHVARSFSASVEDHANVIYIMLGSICECACLRVCVCVCVVRVCLFVLFPSVSGSVSSCNYIQALTSLHPDWTFQVPREDRTGDNTHARPVVQKTSQQKARSTARVHRSARRNPLIVSCTPHPRHRLDACDNA